MKTLKNSLTALAFVFAIGAAFAFTSPVEESFVATVPGHYFDSIQGECVAPKNCTTIQGLTECRFTPFGQPEVNLRPLINGSCSTGTLWELP